MSRDSDFQDYSTVQSPLQPKPPTIASAATIAPSTRASFISGTVAIATITPPYPNSWHELVFIFTTTTPTPFTTTGNIINVNTPVLNVPVLAMYNPNTAKYHLK